MLSAFLRRLSAARALWRHLRFDDSGSVVTILVALPVLAGVVAIGVETGELYRIKRQMQSAADAAALAGSVDRAASFSNTLITTHPHYQPHPNRFLNRSNPAAF